MEKQKLFNTDTQAERVILAAVENERGALTAEQSVEELAELAATAGAEVVGSLIQKRDKIHAGHYLGSGKLEELKDLVALHNADTVICDDELSPGQMRRMSEILNIKVVDRTLLILDIFAGRAQSMEGKVQVELAQLKYSLSHLTGMGKVLSRLGGGIGTRGPGESKLESDKRHIRSRIMDLQNTLKEIRVQRGVQRERRERNNTPVVSLVGYTNAGKSTLMNLLTSAGVLEEDKLFATLDTTTRRLKLPGGTEILLTDTVGFIQKLPHHLIQAFRATLEELGFADILLHVVDSSNPVREQQMALVYRTLDELKFNEQTVVTVFNKMDKEVELPLPNDAKAEKAVQISARTGEGGDELLIAIETVLNSLRKKLRALIPYADGQVLSLVHSRCELLSEEHIEDGTLIELFADDEMQGRLQKYLV